MEVLDELDLSCGLNAWKWAQSQLDSLNLALSSDPDIRAVELDVVRSRCWDYVAQFREVRRQGYAIVHRAIALTHPSKLCLNPIGVHWSFHKKNADIRNIGYHHAWDSCGYRFGVRHVLTGHVTFEAINWESGFSSFLVCGEDEWVCQVIRGEPITDLLFDDVAIPGVGIA